MKYKRDYLNKYYSYKDELIFLLEYKNKILFCRNDRITDYPYKDIKFEENEIIFKDTDIRNSLNETQETFSFKESMIKYVSKHLVKKQERKVEIEVEKLRKSQNILDVLKKENDFIEQNYHGNGNELFETIKAMKRNNTLGLNNLLTNKGKR